VEKEHGRYLRDSQRNEERSEIAGPSGKPLSHGTGQLDFQSLISGASLSMATSAAQTPPLNELSKPTVPVMSGATSTKTTSWEDDVWGSILDGVEVRLCFLRRFFANFL